MPSDLKDEILAAIAGEALITFVKSLGFDPRRKGREWVMLCPFHDDHHPSFAIIPTKGRGEGVFKCQSCGWGGTVFKFTHDSAGLQPPFPKGFKTTLNYMALKLGLHQGGKPAAAAATGPAPRRERIAVEGAPTVLTPPEIAGYLRRFSAAAEDPAPSSVELGVSPRAVAMLGAVVCRIARCKESGTFVPRSEGRLCQIVPMRTGLGELSSLRFTSLEPRKPGERRARWSLDEIKPGVYPHVQTRYSLSGLMAPLWCFGAPPGPTQISVMVEGETDLEAGLTTMLPYGADESDMESWPARWIGLPGVTACHDLLLPSLLGPMAATLMDQDRAGTLAVFDHRRRRCPKCRKIIPHHRVCKACGVPAPVDRTEEMIPGLISKLAQRGTFTMAAFPPTLGDGVKPDVRELVRSGWDWPRLNEHLMATGTANPRPMDFRD